MNLAWKEIKFYKFRFILIMLIVFLMSTMVLFISGLAQGLARENISLFDHLKGNQFIIQKMKEPQLEKSSLNSKQQFKINKIVNEQPIKMMSKTLNIKGNEENVVALNYTTENKFNLKSGTYPNHKNEIVVNEKLIAKGIKKGDKVKFTKEGKQYKVVGILKDAMYSHSNVILMNQNVFQNKNNGVASFYSLSHLSSKQKHEINSIKGVQHVKAQELTNHIASYKAEQSPLKMMIYSLFIITAIVLSAFFYVMTIQKISEIGILKAIGISTPHLLISLIVQISVITLIGVIISEALIILINQILPVTMPFHLEVSNMLVVLIIFLIVGLIGASLSFIKLLKIDPIEAIGGNE